MDFQGITFTAWFWVLIAVTCSLVITLIIKRLIVSRIAKTLARKQLQLNVVVVQAVNWPLTLIVLLLHLILFERLLAANNLKFEGVSVLTTTLVQLLLIGALILFFDRFLTGLVSSYSSRSSVVKNSQGIIMGLARSLVLGIGILIALGTLGISIAPIIASLGITSLAVALALQPTLTNFFSGAQLVLDKPIRVV